MRLIWTTDLHLNFADRHAYVRLISAIRDLRGDALLIGGDTGEAHSFPGYVDRLQSAVGLPVYMVLGNHDFYGDSIANVSASMINLTRLNPKISWLSRQPAVLSSTICLAGLEGWGDAGYGDYFHSRAQIADFDLIEDFKGLSIDDRFSKLKELGASVNATALLRV